MSTSLGIATVVLTWLIGARIFNRRLAWYPAILTALLLPLMLKGDALRGADLYVVLALAAIALCVGELTTRRAVAIALLLAASLMLSIKTLPVIAALAIGLMVTRRRSHGAYGFLAVVALLFCVMSPLPVTARDLLPVLPLGSVLALPLILRARESMQIPDRFHRAPADLCTKPTTEV
ncbi:MAG: hypothetical protein ACXVJT_18290 [Thermoanaerobaculia bacterium]